MLITKNIKNIPSIINHNGMDKLTGHSSLKFMPTIILAIGATMNRIKNNKHPITLAILDEPFLKI